MTPVWMLTDTGRAYPYCVLRAAPMSGACSTLCCLPGGVRQPTLVTTDDPGELACPACRRHLGVTSRGAAVAVDEDYDDLAISREPTADLRKPRMVGVEAVGEWT